MEVQTNGNEEEQQMRGLDENIETDYWTESNVESYKSTTDRNKLVSRLLQVCSSVHSLHMEIFKRKLLTVMPIINIGDKEQLV